ncbi:MAG: metal ABC transporter substrate-binding protein [Acidimicrobiaceae bacterium]|nr:metal ABC transporter substrate-binding protein [Acidimicrobiaceae bacterium]
MAAAVLAVTACGASACSGDSATVQPAPDAGAGVPTILATTGIWGDVVANVACGGLAEVETIIPVGGDPHGYEPSLQDRARMESAALVVANGLLLEEGLVDTLEAVAESGTPVFELAEGMDTFPYSFQGAHEGHDHDEDSHEDDHDDHEGHDHDDEAHEDDHEGHDHDEDSHEDDHDDHEGHDHDDEAHEDDHDDHEGHDHSGDDPHVWFDPHRVSEALPALAQALKTSAGLDPAAVDACLASYQAELDAVDAEIAAMVEQVPAESRKLVTNHEALAYFADRYGFEVIGTVIPTPASMAQASPAQLEELAEIIEHEGVKALFAETVHSTDDVEALASRVGDVEVVTLYTGSLGPPGSGADTYIGFLRTNTELIVDALD